MNTIKREKLQSVAFPAILAMALSALLAGCEPSGESAVSTENPPDVDQPGGDEQLLGDVAEFDGFTLRANLSPTENLPDAMAQQYDIEADPSTVLLSVVILEKRPEQQPVPVSGELSARYESAAGQATDIDMRAVEAEGRVSYIGTLNASAQRGFQFVIEAQPEGADEPLEMNFDVQLPERNAD